MGSLWSVFNGNRTLKKGINHCFVDSFFLLIHIKLVARFEENKKLTQQWKVTKVEIAVLKKVVAYFVHGLLEIFSGKSV